MQQDLTLSHSLGVKRVRKAQKLGLPDPNIRFSSVSSGRRHAIGLCKDGSVYHWTNCERIQKIDLPVLEVAQVSANWEHSSILTKDGQVFSIPRPDFIRPSAVDREVPHTVINNELGVNFQSLLVDRNVFENPDPNDRDEFVQIAGILGQTIALTKNGRVLKLSTEDALGFSTNPTQHAIELTRFSSNGNNKFVAGNHHSFGVCTSDGKVLLGHVDSQRDTPPTTFTEFDGHNVCKMSFGE
jgi:alpha-tubulin suppressor-like RCC1 family protein